MSVTAWPEISIDWSRSPKALFPSFGEPPEGWRDAIKHQQPLNKVDLPPRFSSKVVGVSFAPGYPTNLWKLDQANEPFYDGPKMPLVLVREHDNPHDVNAVRIDRHDTSDEIGHLPAALAGRLAPLLDAGATFTIASYEVLVIPGKERQPGLSVNIIKES